MNLKTLLPIIIFFSQFYIYYIINKYFKLKVYHKISFLLLTVIVLSRIPFFETFFLKKFSSFYQFSQWPYFIYISYYLFFLPSLILGVSFYFITKRRRNKEVVSKKQAITCSFILAFALFSYAFYSATYNFKIKHININSSKLENNINKLRIVHLSDLHLDSLTGQNTLKRIKKLIEAQNPDLIIITGDLVDTNMTGRQKDAEILKSIKSKYGNFAVIGNHEISNGYEMSVKFHKDAGLTLLEGESVEIAGIIISGVSDPTTLWVKLIETELILLKREHDKYKDNFILLLKHQPLIEQEAIGMFDLILTGHTHHGQIWPMHHQMKRSYPLYKRGLSELKTNKKNSNKSYIYNNAGVGFHYLPLRFLAPAEITVIDIININK